MYAQRQNFSGKDEVYEIMIWTGTSVITQYSRSIKWRAPVKNLLAARA